MEIKWTLNEKWEIFAFSWENLKCYSRWIGDQWTVLSKVFFFFEKTVNLAWHANQATLFTLFKYSSIRRQVIILLVGPFEFQGNFYENYRFYRNFLLSMWSPIEMVSTMRTHTPIQNEHDAKQMNVRWSVDTSALQWSAFSIQTARWWR